VRPDFIEKLPGCPLWVNFMYAYNSNERKDKKADKNLFVDKIRQSILLTLLKKSIIIGI